MSTDRLYLESILEAIRKIQRYTVGGRDAFMSDDRTQDAVIRNFEIIGEAAKRLSPPVREAENQIPWREVSGFRNVLIHDYLGVDLKRVWNVVEDHLPALEAAVKRLLG